MKLTNKRLKRIIKEEVQRALKEVNPVPTPTASKGRAEGRQANAPVAAGKAIWARNANRAMIHLNKIDAIDARLAWDDVKKAYTKACKRGGGQKYVDAAPWNPKCDPEPLKKAGANGASDDLAAQRWIQFALQHDRKKIDDKKSNWYYMKVEALAKRLWDLYKSGKTQ